MITVGSIVSLNGWKYKVHQVQTENGRTVPLAIKSIDSHGIEDSYMHKDTNGAWFEHKWNLVETPIPIDPKAKIIAKIKYLDEKFKKAQALKKALRDPNVSSVSLSSNEVAPPVDWSTTSSFTRAGRETTMSYREFMDYYARMQETIAQRTPY